MRLRNIPQAKAAVADSAYCIQDAAAHKGQWRALLPGAKHLYVEIGSGKGGFLIETARRHPDTLVIGIERYASVIYKALNKLKEDAPRNLFFVNTDALLLTELFAQGEIDRIYLNFSDPWPKARHADRRLTSADYLRRYDQVLCADGQIEFKTDNRTLFDWSCEEVQCAGWHIPAMTHDLHADPAMNEGNVMTEYEKRFSDEGHPICKMIIRR